METIGFTYDPLQLTRLLLQIHLEKKYNEEYPKSQRYAIFEFMRTIVDSEIEELLHEYVDTEKVDAITLEESDMNRLEHYLRKSERYKNLCFDFQKKGIDGLGVACLNNQRFTPCSLGHHWDTLSTMLQSGHGKYGDAFGKIMYSMATEYNGVTTEQLDVYITNTFVLVGSSNFTNQGITNRKD